MVVLQLGKKLELALKLVKIKRPWGAWEAQLVEHLTLAFGGGHDLRVLGWSPM